jgi:hypothetical protein
MNPFLFSADDSSPWDANPTKMRWFPRSRLQDWKWPEDYRSAMGWVFALTILGGLGIIAHDILHPRSLTLLQNILVGPMFYSAMTVMAGIALWAIWKDKSWARWWAVAASTLYFLEFLRQFIIPVRPVWDHHLSSLIVGVCGVVAFSSHAERVDLSQSNLSRS